MKIKTLIFGLVISILTVCNFSNAFEECTEYARNKSVPLNSSYCTPIRSNGGFSVRCKNVPVGAGRSTEVRYDGSLSVFNDTLCTNSDYPYLMDVLAGLGGAKCCTVTSKMPVSELTPAIDGLHDTVKQLIPIFLYIGFGILLVTIGFVAIRRLVNWLWGKLKSYFSSKKG